MAEKVLWELTATVRAYSHGGASSLVRVRMFGEMTGMLRTQTAIHGRPVDRKADFFLFVLAAFTVRGGECHAVAFANGGKGGGKGEALCRRAKAGAAPGLPIGLLAAQGDAQGGGNVVQRRAVGARGAVPDVRSARGSATGRTSCA